MPETRIFVSHAHEDRELAKRVEQRLSEETAGARLKFVNPFELADKGEDVRKAIREEIATADKVVVAFSENSLKSEWVNYELGIADALDKPIIVFGKKGSGKSSLASVLPDFQSVDLEEVI